MKTTEANKFYEEAIELFGESAKRAVEEKMQVYGLTFESAVEKCFCALHGQTKPIREINNGKDNI